MTPTNTPGLPRATASRPASTQAQFDSRELMRGAREVLIHHGGQVYRLQHTRNDKLILVK
ncbi:MAG: hemin uptake protein HemP [Arenimonas sp.]|nr:hemin uptake protein HemP [Arenimonas sp.]MBW8366812.1 hemin uptake protein HemP [Arenimonas sp.]